MKAFLKESTPASTTLKTPVLSTELSRVYPNLWKLRSPTSTPLLDLFFATRDLRPLEVFPLVPYSLDCFVPSWGT